MIYLQKKLYTRDVIIPR